MDKEANVNQRPIAIVGGGIVGTTTAFYLKKFTGGDITLYDDPQGQASRAAAGIISPWFSLRTNKRWYRLVKNAAAFYPQFLKDIGEDPESSTIYRSNGTLIFKKKPEILEKVWSLALDRREEAPEIGKIELLSPDEIRQIVPIYDGDQAALYASGGARVDGRRLMEKMNHVLKGIGVKLESTRVETLDSTDKGYRINGHKDYDQVVLATGAWMQELLGQLGYDSDSKTQKGQLALLQLQEEKTNTWPVIQPPSSKSVVPFEDGHIIVGATHEKEMGFDLDIDPTLIHGLIDQVADEFSDSFRHAEVIQYRVGIRGYTSDSSPYFGRVPGHDGLYAANGLGASGLTAGPLVGYILAQVISGQEPLLNLADYATENYIKKR